MNPEQRVLFWVLRERIERLETQHAATRWVLILVCAGLICAVVYLSGGSGP